MFTQDTEDLTQVEDIEEATQFDPNPFGARQRMLPRGNFIINPKTVELQLDDVEVAEPAPVMRLPPAIVLAPAYPLAPPSQLGASKLIAPLFVAAVSLAIAYIAKPSSDQRQPVATTMSTFAAPAIEQRDEIVVPEFVAFASPEAVRMLARSTEPEPYVAAPEVAPEPQRVVTRKHTRGVAPAKRRAIRIDATDTASPLGRMRPGR